MGVRQGGSREFVYLYIVLSCLLIALEHLFKEVVLCKIQLRSCPLSIQPLPRRTLSLSVEH